MTPTSFDESITPFIAIGGAKYPVPELVPRQLRHIRNALFELNSRLGQGGSGQAAIDVFIGLKDEDYDRLLLEPVFWALTRAHPELKKEDFLDLPWTDSELIGAWFVVRKQSGLFVFGGDEKPGEAQAGESPAQNQTGTS